MAKTINSVAKTAGDTSKEHHDSSLLDAPVVD